MRWLLILRLSLLGLVMAFATLTLVPPTLEPVLWLAIFFASAYWLARGVQSKIFLHGLLVGVANSIWITAAHITFFSIYLAHHPREAAMIKTMPASIPPRVMMALVGPLVGIATGIVIGLLSLLVTWLIRRGPNRGDTGRHSPRDGSKSE